VAFHIAQYNIARMRAPIDDPIMRGFASRLDELNHLADRTPHFIWRLADESDNSTGITPYEDKMVIINLSVWDDIDALHAFAYRSAHGPAYAARHEWFEPIDGHTLVLWWVEAGHKPSVDEAVERLALLQRLGPTPDAFTMKRRFPAPAVTTQ
jgi:hypothetical protein